MGGAGGSLGGVRRIGDGFHERIALVLGENLVARHGRALLHHERGVINGFDAGFADFLIQDVLHLFQRQGAQFFLAFVGVESLYFLVAEQQDQIIADLRHVVVDGVDDRFVPGHDREADLQVTQDALVLEINDERRVERLVDGGLSGGGGSFSTVAAAGFGGCFGGGFVFAGGLGGLVQRAGKEQRRADRAADQDQRADDDQQDFLEAAAFFSRRFGFFFLSHDAFPKRGR